MTKSKCKCIEVSQIIGVVILCICVAIGAGTVIAWSVQGVVSFCEKMEYVGELKDRLGYQIETKINNAEQRINNNLSDQLSDIEKLKTILKEKMPKEYANSFKTTVRNYSDWIVFN